MAVFTEPNTSHPTNLFTIQRDVRHRTLDAFKIIIPSYELRSNYDKKTSENWRFIVGIRSDFFSSFFFFLFVSKEIKIRNWFDAIIVVLVNFCRGIPDSPTLSFIFLANISPLARGVTNNRFNRDSTCL